MRSETGRIRKAGREWLWGSREKGEERGGSKRRRTKGRKSVSRETEMRMRRVVTLEKMLIKLKRRSYKQ